MTSFSIISSLRAIALVTFLVCRFTFSIVQARESFARSFLIEHVFFTLWLVFEREGILTRPSRGAKALVILLEIKTSKIFRFLGAF